MQIRTWEMHHTAEYGVAAHWKYKAGMQGKDKLEERLAWVRQLLESQQDSDDAEDLRHAPSKPTCCPRRSLSLPPRATSSTCPAAATVIDFAYAIHSAVGNRMIGAKVDGRIVPLDYKVKTGEIVEVLTTSAPRTTAPAGTG